MSTIDDFQAEGRLIEYLAAQLASGRLALILGAGVSKPFGLPDWDELLDRMFKTKGMARPPAPLERQAEFFRSKYYDSDVPGLLSAVHDALYGTATADFASLRANATLSAIGALVMASRRGSVTDVITFNYDDVLELYLSYHGFVVSSVCELAHWSEGADVTVFHPHGFIPHDVGGVRSKAIVLDQHSYSSIVGDSTNIWRQTVLGVMRRRTCLFVGVSGNDNNLDSMLVECEKVHAGRLIDGTPFWGIVFSTGFDEVSDAFWKKRGVFPKVVTDYGVDLPRILFAVCQGASKIGRT